MRSYIRRIFTLLLWISIAVLSSAIYGLVNDQITVTISPEYYSVFKHHQFGVALERFGIASSSARLQAMAVGVLATWWYGVFLGVMLSISSMVGRYKPLSTRRYVQALLWVIAATLGASVVFGVVAYVAEPLVRPTPENWPFLSGIVGIRRAFAVCWWHNGAYLGAFIASVAASFHAQRQRTLAGDTRLSGDV